MGCSFANGPPNPSSDRETWKIPLGCVGTIAEKVCFGMSDLGFMELLHQSIIKID